MHVRAYLIVSRDFCSCESRTTILAVQISGVRDKLLFNTDVNILSSVLHWWQLCIFMHAVKLQVSSSIILL